MQKVILKQALIGLLALTLVACGVGKSYRSSLPPTYQHHDSYFVQSKKLEVAQRLFNDGYYKQAKLFLLPLACEGNMVAQYALGYEYYYGYGVAQDTDVGYFWVKRSAEQGYAPAIKAVGMIEQEQREYKAMTRRTSIGLGGVRGSFAR